MPSRRGSTRYRQGTRNGGRRTRRRTSISSRVRYQRPSARNQARQISTLARMAVRSARVLNAHRVFQDWELKGTLSFTADGFLIRPLMDPINWDATLRQDITPLTQSQAFAREMQFTYYAANNTKQTPFTINLFICTLRRNFNEWDGLTMVSGSEYLDQGVGNAVMLNSGQFKVHYSRNMQIFPRVQPGVDSSGATIEPTGNPNSQYRRATTTIRLNNRLTSPDALSWKQLTINDMPYYQRMYLMCYFNCADTSPSNDARLNWCSKFTTITQD